MSIRPPFAGENWRGGLTPLWSGLRVHVVGGASIATDKVSGRSAHVECMD